MSLPPEIRETEIPAVLELHIPVFSDARGFFSESYNQETWATVGFRETFVQDNVSLSSKGVLRGLHYQLFEPQGKLVRVLHGAVFDVAVDLRRSSPRFGQWAGFLLSGENHRMAWIPPGFAHGFLALTGSADVLYKVTAPRHEPGERSLRWNDPVIGIGWPLGDIGRPQPLLSAKDAAAPALAQAQVYD